MPSVPFTYETLAIAAKHYEETDIKVCWSFPILLDFFTLPRQFCPGLFIFVSLILLFSKIFSVLKKHS